MNDINYESKAKDLLGENCDLNNAELKLLDEEIKLQSFLEKSAGRQQVINTLITPLITTGTIAVTTSVFTFINDNNENFKKLTDEIINVDVSKTVELANSMLNYIELSNNLLNSALWIFYLLALCFMIVLIYMYISEKSNDENIGTSKVNIKVISIYIKNSEKK